LSKLLYTKLLFDFSKNHINLGHLYLNKLEISEGPEILPSRLHIALKRINFDFHFGITIIASAIWNYVHLNNLFKFQLVKIV